MSAAYLRETATLMRERAEAARTYSDATTGLPLAWRPNALGQVHGLGADFVCDAAPGLQPHIASWHPAVALAVADLLDRAADDHDETPCPAIDAALTVARAYRGDPS